MTRFRVGLLEKEWPWLVVVVLFLSAAIYLTLEHYGITVAVAGQIEIAKDLIQVNGLLIAFTGIVFTGMLAEVRFRTERALQAADHERAERLEMKSKALRRSALAGFLFFSASLGDALGNLAAAVGSTASPTSMASTFVLPMVLLVAGVALLMIAFVMVASE